ncbi:hypothetical protein BST27_22300 [Mycobacterium intermedium]|uniref:Uncharacterized protein n=1 Tax=Mycobacterium intermedium TaxID=28445 RepID=A0A1E3SBR7_MYCIE|nr:hypothetical protein BHQ20_19140 [Mycobacterium intermedium]OPE49147.1 hypothetical protein BV508_15345 [Mycobacterium intermedium]ORA97512.1 hypothetical protein BST27_22300 [Mycobacterium intermedium]
MGWVTVLAKEISSIRQAASVNLIVSIAAEGEMMKKSVAVAGLVAGLATGLFAASAGIAHANASAPVGFWVNQTGSEQLLVSANGCSLADGAGIPTTSGPCSWNPSSNGGILTILSSRTRTPSPVYFNVLWINQTTISVYGDVFYRRA